MGKQNIQTMPYWTPSTMCNLCCRITKDQLTRDISFACCKNSFHAQLTIHSGLSITPSITDRVHRNENFVEIIPVFSTLFGSVELRQFYSLKLSHL